MSDEIIKIRERLVELSTDPIETRELLDKLIAQHDAECPIVVTKNDIKETKYEKAYKLHKTRNGFLLQYYSGYSVLVDGKIYSTASALQQIMDGVPSDASDVVNPETGMSEKYGIETMLSAAEMIFRLPLFVFSHEITVLNIAAMGAMYINLYQRMGKVPTAETDNPEYDKAIIQMNELIENFAAGLEKEGREYERRMGYGKEAESESKSEGKDDSQSKA